MGMGYIYNCPKCNRKFELMLGIGMLDFDLLNLDNEVNIIEKCQNNND